MVSFDTGDLTPYVGPNFEDTDHSLYINRSVYVTTDLVNHANCTYYTHGDWREPPDLNARLAGGEGPFQDGDWVPASRNEYWCFIGGIREGSEVCLNPGPSNGCRGGVETLELTVESGGPLGVPQYRVHISPAADADATFASKVYVQCLAQDQSAGF